MRLLLLSCVHDIREAASATLNLSAVRRDELGQHAVDRLADLLSVLHEPLAVACGRPEGDGVAPVPVTRALPRRGHART
jgi:hypothetical protein